MQKFWFLHRRNSSQLKTVKGKISSSSGAACLFPTDRFRTSASRNYHSPGNLRAPDKVAWPRVCDITWFFRRKDQEAPVGVDICYCRSILDRAEFKYECRAYFFFILHLMIKNILSIYLSQGWCKCFRDRDQPERCMGDMFKGGSENAKQTTTMFGAVSIPCCLICGRVVIFFLRDIGTLRGRQRC